MSNLLDEMPLQGYKTYIIALLMIVYAIIGYILFPETSGGIDAMVKMILEALAIIGLRLGIESTK